MSGYFHHLFEGEIDFDGQKRVEKSIHYAISAITILSFALGFSLQSLSVTFLFFGISLMFLFLIVVPPWPTYNRHPVKWLPNKESRKNQ